MKSILEGLGPVEADEVIAQARDFMGTKLHELVKERLKDHYVSILAAEPSYSLTAVDAHASLRVLEQVYVEIGLAATISKGRPNVRSR